MKVVLLLAIIVGTPILVVGGVQILIWKLIGVKALRAVSAIMVLICGYWLVVETVAPPLYGNKSALVGLGSLPIGILMVESLIIVCAPLMRRFIAWEKSVEAARSAEQKI